MIRVNSTGEATIGSDETTFPNGLVITPDGEKLIVADSLQSRLHQWDLAADGTITNHSLFAEIPDSMPDGICLDAADGIWVTSHHRVHRVLEGGGITDEVDMGTTRATACMLGGPDGRTLLITASDSHDRKIITDNPSGRLFTVHTDFPGAGLPSFY